MMASLFENSIEKANFSSPMFIRRFMVSNIALYFENKSYLSLSITEDDVIDDINEKYKCSTKNPMYSKNEMYWIGYIYAALSFLYSLSFKQVYKLFPAKEIVKYYNIYHTFDVEESSERMMENIGYIEDDFMIKGLEILRRLYILDDLKSLIGKKVHVYIDRPKGSKHPNYNNIIYPVNYGYIKEYTALDGEYQDAYVIGVDEPLEEFGGEVIAIINRKNDNEDKIIVAPEGKKFSNKEIEMFVNFQEKYFKYKLIQK